MSDPNHKAVQVIEHHAMTTPLHPLVEMFRRQDGAIDTATMEKLMELQERHEANVARKEFTEALVALKRDLPTAIRKDGENKHTNAKYSTLANIMDGIQDALTAHGFALTYEVSNDPKGVTVTCILTHAGGYDRRSSYTQPPDTGAGRSAIQALGSTQTYLQRYTAIAVLGLATADMPDPDAAPTSPDGIDPVKNEKAVAWLTSQGCTYADAERHIGRPSSQWTAADREEIKRWVKG